MKTILAFSHLVCFACGSLAGEEHWSQFRGPAGAGVAADDASPPIDFGLKKHLVWSRELPPGHSSPSIRGKRSFVTAHDASTKTLRVICLNRDDGTVAFTIAPPIPEIEKVHKVSSPATATAVADDERVYVYFGSFGLLCYDFLGKPQWSRPMPMPKSQFGSGTSPILVEDRLILSRDAGDSKHLLAVDVATGKSVWETPLRGNQMESYATPVVWRDTVVLHRAGQITAFGIEDGKPRWNVPAQTSGCSSPVVNGDTIYVATWSNGGEAEQRVDLPRFADLLKEHDEDEDGKLTRKEFPKDLAITKRPEADASQGGEVLAVWFFDRLDFSKDGKMSAFEWGIASTTMKLLVKDHGLLAIKLEERDGEFRPSIRWKEKKAVPETPSPLFYQRHVYMVKNGGILTCMNPETGKVVYRKRLNATGSYYASPVAADGRIYFASERGVVTVVSAGEKFKVLAQNDLGESIMATPAIVGKHLYVRTESHLHAFAKD